MRKIYLFILLSLSILNNGCDIGVKYSKSKKSGWHIINLGAFTLETPKTYKYHSRQGIDSFVGEIKNKNVTFFFDFGIYSPIGPRDKIEYLEKYKDRLELMSMTHFFNIIDLTTYQDKNGSFNPSTVLSKIKNLKLKEYSDSIELSINYPSQPEFYYEFEYLDKEYRLPLEFEDDALEEIENYSIKKDTINGIARRFFLSKNFNNKSHSGIYLVDLHSFNKSWNDFVSKLIFHTGDLNKTNESEIMEILESIRIVK